jgi:hypothetical protein
MTWDRADFDRYCRDKGEDPTLPLWDEQYAGLVEYERCLKQRNSGKNQRATYVWRALKNKGLIRSTEDRVLKGKGDGFKTLMNAGKREATDEDAVLRYPNFFSPKAIAKATQRFADWDASQRRGR